MSEEDKEIIVQYNEWRNKLREESEKARGELSSIMFIMGLGYTTAKDDFINRVGFSPDKDNPCDGEEYHIYKEGYISGYEDAEMDADETLESKEEKVDFELFKSCEHRECENHDSTLEKEYFIHNPLKRVDNFNRTLKHHLLSANPLMSEAVLVDHNNMIIWTGENIFLQITKENYTPEMIYNSMTPCEQRAYDSLPDVFEVYRGFAYPEATDYSQSLAEQASSWTLDKSVADFFIEYHTKGFTGKVKTNLITATVKKSDVLYVILERSEAEIVIFNHRKVKIKSCEENIITVEINK